MLSTMKGGIPLPFSGVEHSGHELELEKAMSPYEDDDTVLSYTSEVLLDFANVYVASARNMIGEFIGEDLGVESMVLETPIWSYDYASSSDALLVKVSPKTLNTIYEKIMADHEDSFRNRVREELKERNGFIPFYSNDLSKWENFDLWAEAQVGLLIKEAMSQVADDEDLFAWDNEVIKRMKKEKAYERVIEEHHEAMI